MKSEEKSKKVTVELKGDDLLDYELFTVSLGVDGTKREVDRKVMLLALKALENVVSGCRLKTGVKHPSYQEVEKFLVKSNDNLPLL